MQKAVLLLLVTTIVLATAARVLEPQAPLHAAVKTEKDANFVRPKPSRFATVITPSLDYKPLV